jgi:hypothetical protein
LLIELERLSLIFEAFDNGIWHVKRLGLHGGAFNPDFQRFYLLAGCLRTTPSPYLY